MKTTTTSALASAANVHALVKEAFDAVGASFERFCLMAGIESLTQMLGEDVDTLAGGRYEHRPDKPGCAFRRKAATDSNPKRPLIPI